MGITKDTVQGEATNHESITEGTKTDENRNPTDQTDMNKIIGIDRITMDTTDINNRQATTPIKIDIRKFAVKQFLSTKIDHKFRNFINVQSWGDKKKE